MRWLMLFALVLAGCRADQVSKNWARASFQDRNLTLVPDLLEFRYAENRAIAFSMFHQIPEHVRKPLIYSLTSVSLAALLSLIWVMRRQSLYRLASMALILSGAVGNIIDRVRHGFVMDFIHVHWRETWSFPIFNVADSLITIGGAMILLSTFLSPEGFKPSPPN
ncbi:MAG: signal peptidase II [Fibrobacteria bacterium]